MSGFGKAFRRATIPFVRALIVGSVMIVGAEAGNEKLLGEGVGSPAEIAAALAEQIAACVVRNDTRHPVFHGCIDWHSAAHGVWALTAYTGATGDEKYRPLIESILTPDGIAAEKAYLASDPSFEMPYGRAWFLRLAAEHRKVFASDLLAAMADEIAASLVERYRHRPADPEAGAYDSDCWALINLLHYARATNDATLADFVTQIVARDIVPFAEPCDPARERGEFMAICTNRAWLVSEILSPEDFKVWLAGYLPEPDRLVPVETPAGAHENGLNFSRAWGLWAVHAATGDDGYRALYARHFLASYRSRQSWAGEYDAVGHWVAQFGMLALMPMFAR